MCSKYYNLGFTGLLVGYRGVCVVGGVTGARCLRDGVAALFVLTNFFINQSGILLPDDCVANISLLFKSAFSDFDVD
jgi:hypothetical protein